MSARTSIAILWLLWARLESDAAAADSGERVHIRLHMPEVVRKHTHFHKVYKPLPLPVAPIVPPQPLLPAGKPHVSLLGYTTTASGSGGMAPSVMQLMATAATPMSLPMTMSTLKPNYGPALFDSFNKQAETELAAAAPAATPATMKLHSTDSGSGSNAKLLQQLLTSITAAQQQRLQLQQQQMALEAETETEPEPETELENNELLNSNFLAALQREYLSKFGGGQRKRKKVNFLSKPRGRPKPKQPQRQPQQLLQSSSEEQFDDYQEQPATGFADAPEDPNEQYLQSAKSWAEMGDGEEEDSAAAFSGKNNALSAMPSVDEFLNEVGSGNPYAPYYGSMYREYGNTAPNEYGNTGSMYSEYDNTGSSAWQATPTAGYNSYAQVTKATPKRPRPRQRRPTTSFSSATGNTASGNAGKVRYVKLTTRKKRKNRIKAKRYRV